MRIKAQFSLLTILAGCTTQSVRIVPDPGDDEGDDARECTDGADNDRDGRIDCVDPGCWDSPDCTGTAGGTPTGPGTGTATGAVTDTATGTAPGTTTGTATGTPGGIPPIYARPSCSATPGLSVLGGAHVSICKGFCRSYLWIDGTLALREEPGDAYAGTPTSWHAGDLTAEGQTAAVDAVAAVGMLVPPVESPYFSWKELYLCRDGVTETWVFDHYGYTPGGYYGVIALPPEIQPGWDFVDSLWSDLDTCTDSSLLANTRGC